jgi:phage-related minor tail protein
MAQPKDTMNSLLKNKVVAVISVIASLIIPIKIFLEVVPMPATKTDIHRIEKSQQEIIVRIDTVTDAQIQTMLSEIDSLERNREMYTLQKLQMEKRLNDAVVDKTKKEEVDLCLKSLAQIDKNIRMLDQRLADMHERVKTISGTLF